jgi:hypothetical protein
MSLARQTWGLGGGGVETGFARAVNGTFVFSPRRPLRMVMSPLWARISSSHHSIFLSITQRQSVANLNLSGMVTGLVEFTSTPGG